MLGPLVNWLSKVDPNIVIPVVTTVGAWLWRKVAGKKANDIERTIKGAIGSLLAEVIDMVPPGVSVEQYLKTSRGYVEKYVWRALQKRGIPKNKTTEKIVHMVLEEAAHELADELAAKRKERLAPL